MTVSVLSKQQCTNSNCHQRCRSANHATPSGSRIERGSTRVGGVGRGENAAGTTATGTGGADASEAT